MCGYIRQDSSLQRWLSRRLREEGEVGVSCLERGLRVQAPPSSPGSSLIEMAKTSKKEKQVQGMVIATEVDRRMKR